MENRQLTDESVVPDDDLVLATIGDKGLIWKQTMSYLFDNHSDISQVWKYYKDGKCWMLRTVKKKSTICWISILNDTFRIAFYFAERLEPSIIESRLSDELKDQYRNAKAFNKSRPVYIDVEGTDDLIQIKILIDMKLSL